jgi:hypothetical protein
MIGVDFEHRLAAHCETGTVAGQLHHAGLTLSEAMVFGISGGIFFAYLKSPRLPFPMVVPRSKPGQIRTDIAKRLKIDFETRRYRSRAKARDDLDSLLRQGIAPAIQVDMFHMGYFPDYMKVHFNGHFVSIVGKNGDSYTVSDCYYPRKAQLNESALDMARFAKGDLAPKGLLFYPRSVPREPDLEGPIRAGLKEAARNMVKLQMPFLGVRGIRLFAKKVLEWPKLTPDELHLSHEIMKISATLEDRGTGGAGFRFMYATFLQEAAKLVGSEELDSMSKEMMENGDRWRDISLFAGRIGKSRDLGEARLRELSRMIMARAEAEEKIFRRMLEFLKQ